MKRKLNDGLHEIVSVHVAGAHIHDFKGHIDKLAFGTLLKLVPEPANPYDKNAILVMYVPDNPTFAEKKVGYVPAANAKLIGTMLKLGFPLVASVDVVEAHKQLVIIEIACPAWPATAPVGP